MKKPTDHSPALTLQPATSVHGLVQLPGSKSLSIRALLLAALSQGDTVLHGVLDSDDTQVMMGALKQLGVAIEKLGDQSLKVHGGGITQHHADIFVGNSGLSIRTLASALAATPGRFRLFGIARMHERPIADLVDSLKLLGAEIEYESVQGYPPILIHGRKRNDPVACIKVKGNASSQYLTGLLQIAPLLSAQQDMVIEVEGELISKPYVDMTVQLMARFGVAVLRDATQYARFVISQSSQYVSPNEYNVEGDASSASYFLAAAALGKHSLCVKGAGTDSLQGDVAFARFLTDIGIKVQWGADSITVHGRNGNSILPFDTDFNHIPDAAMTAAILALFAQGTSTLRNIGSWRVKETDRLSAMATELRKVGAQVTEGADFLSITPPEQLNTASICTYDDHRIAMCFSLLRFAGIPITIEDPACVNKTFPEYFKVLESVVI